MLNQSDKIVCSIDTEATFIFFKLPMQINKNQILYGFSNNDKKLHELTSRILET